MRQLLLFVLGSAHELVMLQQQEPAWSETKQDVNNEKAIGYVNMAADAASLEIEKNLAARPESFQSSDGGTSTDGLDQQETLEKTKANVDHGMLGDVSFDNLTGDTTYGTVTDNYLDKLKTDDGKKARKKVGKATKEEYDRYLSGGKGYDTAGLYKKAHDEAQMSAIDSNEPDLNLGDKLEKAIVDSKAGVTPVTMDATGAKTATVTDTKKGTSLRENLKQVLETDTKENVNKTKTFLDNQQVDQRRNITGRYETPRLFTNRTGYVKSSWKATDKFAAWEVVGAVDALLSSATSIDAQTGSVGRVGQSSDSPSYSAAQINYKGVKGDVVTGGY